MAAPIALCAADATSESLVTVAAETRAAATSDDPATTYLAVPVAPPPAAGGAITAIAGNTITAAGDDWTGLDALATKPWLLEISRGTSAGWWSLVTSFDSTTQTAVLADTVPTTVVVGDSYQLRRVWMLGEVLGAVGFDAVVPGPTPSLADTIIIVDPVTHAQRTFFYSSVPGNAGWHDATFAPAAEAPVLPGQALILQRRGNAVANVAFTGVDRIRSLPVTVTPGIGVYGAQHPADGPALDDTNLLFAGFQSDATAATADLVLVPQADGSVRTFFHCDAVGDTGWKNADGTPAADAALLTAGAFLLHIQSGATFTWAPDYVP